MKKSLIPLAGIFLACIICAGMPAVAAADNQNPSFNPTTTIKPAETVQPWYAPITGLFGMNQQADRADQQDSARVVNATSSQSGTAKAWWENLLPSEWVKENSAQVSADNAPTTTPVQNRAPATTQNPVPVITQSPDPAQPANPSSLTPSPPSNQQKPQNAPAQKTP